MTYLNLSMVVTLVSSAGKVRTRPFPLVSFFLLFFASLREAGVWLPWAWKSKQTFKYNQ